LRKKAWIPFLLAGLVFFSPAAGARDRPKVGLALGGGGAKGFAHIPVLKALDALDFPVDYIAGTSAGGILGGLYAAGYSGDALEKLAAETDWAGLFDDRPPRSMAPHIQKKSDGRYQLDLPLRKGIPSAPRGLIYGQKFLTLFSRLTFPLSAEMDFDDLTIPFRCVAVDLISGKEVVLERGSLARAIRATMSIPSLLSPVEWDDRLLVDGGVLNNLPVDVVKAMGAEIIIAVDLSEPLKPADELETPDKILGQTLVVVENEQKRRKLEDVDILIHPDMAGFGILDFFFPEKLVGIKDRGQSAVEKALPALLALKDKYGLSRSAQEGSSDPASARRSSADPARKFALSGFFISGTERTSPAYLSRLSHLKQGQQVDGEILGREITRLFALGLFRRIEFDAIPTSAGTLELRLLFEEHPRGRLRIGLGYDNFHKLVAAAGVDFMNLLLPGLRLENEVEVGGQTRFRSQLSLPAQTLDAPVYPFFQLAYQNIPTRLYDGAGDLISTFKNRFWSLAFGFCAQIKKSISLEVSAQTEFMNAAPIGVPPRPELFTELNANLTGLSVNAAIDTRDGVWTPNKGILVRARYEGRFAGFGSDVDYKLAEASFDGYHTFRPGHTLRAYGCWGTSSAGTPFYKFLNQGHPDFFVGMKYDQLLGSKMKILRAEYRYSFSRVVHLKFIGNAAFDFDQNWPEFSYSAERLWGIGVGIHASTPAGPLELVYGVGSQSVEDPNSAQGVLYLRLGARF
jgi:NTE family protein